MPAAPANWLPVLAHCWNSCWCSGQCGRQHPGSYTLCSRPAELVAPWDGSPAAGPAQTPSSPLEPGDSIAWCTDCHRKTAARRAERSRRTDAPTLF